MYGSRINHNIDSFARPHPCLLWQKRDYEVFRPPYGQAKAQKIAEEPCLPDKRRNAPPARGQMQSAGPQEHVHDVTIGKSWCGDGPDGKRHHAAFNLPFKNIVGGKKLGGSSINRGSIKVCRGALLNDGAIAHEQDAVTKFDSLHGVMGHENGGCACFLDNRQGVGPHLVAQALFKISWEQGFGC